MTEILVLEEVSPAGLEALRAEPRFHVTELYGDDRKAIEQALATAEALIVRSKTKVTCEFMELAPALKVIGRAGTGVDNIDVPGATRRGIVVMNTPAGNSISAAEHALGLMMSLLRKIPQADSSVKSGRWERGKFMGSELHGKVLGVVGLGKIGTEVVRRAQAFKTRILVFDPFVSDSVARDMGVKLVSFEELLRESEIVTLHAPLTQTTRKLINAETLALMRDGAFLVNAARGDLVDEAALVTALKSGKLAGAALDVYTGEPKPNPELISLPNTVTTPHIGASTVEAQEKVGLDLALQVKDYFVDGIVRNAVNFPSISLADYQQIAPFLELGQKLGAFASQLSTGRMEELSVRYYGELTELNTHLICSSILVGVLGPILTDRVTLVNALTTAKERGIHFQETRSTRVRSYNNLISVKLKTDAGEQWVEGTVLHKNHLHLVSLYGIDVDAPLTGDMLVMVNVDTPGVIGRVGTLLGDHSINIANFALGRSDDSREAVGIVNVDSEIPVDLLRDIQALPQVKLARVARV
jgi:D-3-phosphoglycerate dehydrogenase / 2-oxoglutarate reductase